MSKTDKLEIADQMLESAIEEYIDKERYFSAFNLAGVAEEIYGKFIRVNGGKDAQASTIEAVERINKIRGWIPIPVKEWKKIANRPKNSVKHLDNKEDRFIDIEIKVEACLMLGEALSNHATLDRKVTPVIQRFYELNKDW
ncbi:hypothetical protein [Shewanella frigidimarina]|uniref:hypothetical protein n=1 Tax=Shewanella frigidimarina TaxID=56812 RepID=UPI000F4D9EDC|nr:hypothetical protein [Shewanella frigidimarina]RPA31946.1 hypothetical protein EGC78_09445 [Shewanella frigidimarina]